MQVVAPIDIEDSLRIDIAANLSGVRVFAPPIPPDLSSGDVLITSVGGGRIAGASSEYDVSIDCYAPTEAAAVLLANEVSGVLVSLPIRATSTQYNAATAGTPYQNNDPRAPQLARRTFRASVICPGDRLTF